MKKADIYIKTDSSSPKQTEKRYGYVMECKVAGEIKTREGFGKITGTYHKAVLTALIEALERFKEPCEIYIHTEDVFVLNMIELNLAAWAEKEFQTTKGKQVANKEEWAKIWDLSNKHLILTELGAHQYSRWLMQEMKDRIFLGNPRKKCDEEERKCLKNSEN